jgi:hypothetical protein
LNCLTMVSDLSPFLAPLFLPSTFILANNTLFCSMTCCPLSLWNQMAESSVVLSFPLSGTSSTTSRHRSFCCVPAPQTQDRSKGSSSLEFGLARAPDSPVTTMVQMFISQLSQIAQICGPRLASCGQRWYAFDDEQRVTLCNKGEASPSVDC